MTTKTLLITGANRGTGYGVAKHFHEQGYRIVALNKTLLNQPWMEEIQCDLGNFDQLMEACKRVLEITHTIDVCFLNAAIRRLSYIEEMPVESWQDSVNVNYSAVFYLLKKMMPVFKKSRTFVVVMGSHAGSYFFDGGAAYCSTKAALKALVEVFIQETRQFGIRATLINAGAINNRPKGNDNKKMQPESLAHFVHNLIQSSADILPAEIEIRPSIPLKPADEGIAKIQYV